MVHYQVNTNITDIAQADSATRAWLDFITIPSHFTVEKVSDTGAPLLGELSGDDLLERLYSYKPQTDSKILRPISAAWRGGKNVVTEVADFPREATRSSLDTYTNLGIALCLAVFLLLSFDRIAVGIINAFATMFNLRKQQTAERGLKYKNCRNNALAFGLFAVAFILSNKLVVREFVGEPLIVVFPAMAAALSLYLLFKWAVFKALDFVNRSSAFKFLTRVGYNYLIIITLFILLGELALYLFPETFSGVIAPWYIASCLIPAAIYLYMALVIFLKNRFSLFFYILYLCAVEFLPIALIAKII